MNNFQSQTPQQQPKVAPDSVFYQFSPEETAVMKECNRESFYQRSLPLTAIFGGGAFMGVRAGFLKPNAKYGPWPKVIACGLFGFFMGKYSYQSICAEKLMKLPNSEIGRVLRERHGRMKNDGLTGSVLSPAITTGAYGTDPPIISTDYKSDVDIDMHKPMNSLDTDYRPDYDGLSVNRSNETPLPSFNSPTSYDELRARNRQEYDRTQPNKPIYRPPPSSNTQPIWENQPYAPQDSLRNTPQPKESRNQYGDVFN